MKLLFAFGWLPVPVFYVKHLFAGGFTPLVMIFIKDKYRTDEGLHRHELYHVEQAYKLLLVPFALLYLFSVKFRFKVELAAYRVQMLYLSSNGGPSLSREQAVSFLYRDYGLHMTEADIREEFV